MHAYLHTLDTTQKFGTHKSDRTGTGTQSFFGQQQRYSLRDGDIAVVTSKYVHLKSVIHELLWMLSGDTRLKYLLDNGVTIWNEWVKPGTEVYRMYTATEIVELIRKHMLKEYPTSQFFDVVMVKDHRDKGRMEFDEERLKTTLYIDFDRFHDESRKRYRKIEDEVAEDKSAYWEAVYKTFFDKEPKVLVDGDLGPVYGKIWRDITDMELIPKTDFASYQERGFEFVVDVPGTSMETDQVVVRRKIDQIKDLLDQFATNPDSRRLLVSAWDPRKVDQQALPPCHTLFQFWTRELTLEERIMWLRDNDPGYYTNLNAGSSIGFDPEEYLTIAKVPTRAISCQLYARSQDLFLGTPFNLAFYSILTAAIANQFNWVCDEFIWTGGDCHIYSNHVNQVETQRGRDTFPVPKIRFSRPGINILDLTYDDIIIEDYQHHSKIPAPVAV